MTAHTRTANLSPGFMPATTAHTTSRALMVAASVVIEAIIVLGFVASSVGLGRPPYPDPDHGWASPAPSVAPAAPAVEAPATSGASGPQPAPAPAP